MVGRLAPRVDKLTVCLGGCGKKLVRGFYFCGECEPADWDYRNPDTAKALALSAKQAGKVNESDLPDWLRTKPRTHRQEREAKAWCAQQGRTYPYDDLPPKRPT